MLQIDWAETATAGYYENLEYWIARNQSPDYALKIISATEDAEKILSENPFIGRKTTAGAGIFKIVILRKFYIYYTVSEEFIMVLAFKAVHEDFQKHQFGI